MSWIFDIAALNVPASMQVQTPPSCNIISKTNEHEDGPRKKREILRNTKLH